MRIQRINLSLKTLFNNFLLKAAAAKILQNMPKIKLINSAKLIIVLLFLFISNEFHNIQFIEKKLEKKISFTCLYISNAAPYLYQWNVIASVGRIKGSCALK